MKRNGKKNIQLLRNLISTFSGDIPRKTVVALATSNNLIENDTYPLIKPIARGNERGTYNVDKMLELADKILNKGKKVKPSTKKAVKKPSLKEEILAMTPTELVDESGMFEAAAAIHEEKNYSNRVWGEVPYTEDDVNDELSLMGTYL